MKKLSLYLTLAFAGLFMASCGPEDNEFAGLKVAEPDEAVVIPGINAGEVSLIDLNAYEISDELDVQAFVLPETTIPGGTTLQSAEIVFADGTVLPATPDGQVSGKALSDYIASLYGLRPLERSVTGTVYVYAVQNGAVVKVNAGEITINAIPRAPEIENKYYITGTINGWDNTDKTYEVTNGGGDPYEDPTFTITINVDDLKGEGLTFKLTPESGLGGDWGKCLAAADEEGKFNYNNAGGDLTVPAPTDEAKYLRLTFNMLDQTWSYEYIAFAPYIYEIGNEGGWSENHPLASNGDGTYTGFVYLDGEFKFKPNEGDWNGDWEWDGDGKIIESGGPNIPAAYGLHRIDVDIVNLTYTLTKINYVDMVGDATVGGWGEGTVLEWDAAEKCFSVVTTIAAEGSVKFRGNGTWDNFDGNWGGTLDNLINGSNDNCTPTKRGENVKVRFYAKGNCYATME